jgi:positive regulator of sigma E activity
MASRDEARVEQGVRATGAIYGTILVTALVAGLSEDPDYNSRDILESVLITAAVFWLAHVYARVLGERVGGDERGARTLTWAAMLEEWPLLQAAVLPCVALLLGVAGLYSRNSSVNVAIGLGVASLLAFGFLFARRLRRPLMGALLTGGVNAVAGLVIIVLKLLID